MLAFDVIPQPDLILTQATQKIYRYMMKLYVHAISWVATEHIAGPESNWAFQARQQREVPAGGSSISNQ
jgi:hypothetical protein